MKLVTNTRLSCCGIFIAFMASASYAQTTKDENNKEVVADNLRTDNLRSDNLNVQTIVVNGSHIRDTQAATSILFNADKVDRINASSFSDLLHNLAGVDVSQPGGAGGVTELFIRGAESNFTLVTVNSVRVNDTTNSHGGAFDLSTINPDDIESVEIVKGPVSSAYGSDALAGALNIKTKKPFAGTEIKVREDLGGDGYQRNYLSANFGTQNIAANIRVAHLDSGEQVKGSSAETQSVGSDLKWNLGSQDEVIGSVNFIDRKRNAYPTGSGGLLFAASDDLEFSHSKDKQTGLLWTHLFNDQWQLINQAAYFNREESVDSPAIEPGVTQGVPAMQGKTELTRKNINTNLFYDYSSQLKFALGLDYQQEEGISHAVYDFGFPMPSDINQQRDNFGAFAEINYHADSGFEAFASTRSDKPENRKQETSSKISVSYPVFGSDSHLGARWGQGFKLPSFYALGDQIVGNKDLKSETSESTEIFYNQSFSNNLYHINASHYHSDYRQLIDFDFSIFKLINRNKVTIDGNELEFVINPLSGLEVGMHWTQNHFSFDDSGGAGHGPLRGRPENSGGFYVEWLNTDWSSRLQYYYVGERPSESTPTGPVTLKAYQRIDAVLVRKFSDNLSINFNIDNLLNEDYQEEIGFPSPGRLIRVGLSARF